MEWKKKNIVTTLPSIVDRFGSHYSAQILGPDVFYKNLRYLRFSQRHERDVLKNKKKLKNVEAGLKFV